MNEVLVKTKRQKINQKKKRSKNLTSNKSN